MKEEEEEDEDFDGGSGQNTVVDEDERRTVSTRSKWPTPRSGRRAGPAPSVVSPAGFTRSQSMHMTRGIDGGAAVGESASLNARGGRGLLLRLERLLAQRRRSRRRRRRTTMRSTGMVPPIESHRLSVSTGFQTALRLQNGGSTCWYYRDAAAAALIDADDDQRAPQPRACTRDRRHARRGGIPPRKTLRRPLSGA